ncbi:MULTISPECIES: nitroreductase family deazaflavin-dependent oxidoreductase [Prauserella salsuginis group]|uniref:Nitroreductase family deazaflavin-dependent oxidoreductase n=1 Tax=Prauserella salsuginis TaxID=387889 RepID=A0ABW6FZE7_9PSEU|nr:MULTISPECIES: nitroreductase family deazaflavin-dependent oxidoreductase [Prauserella salsuginis group]MCR3721056.1 deazaflavin-dependent oxidoreductase, nitroreductase family [Prauserella flava]MCR3734863.1 deazaflavin-dependent oxidoreductase, nitroreductase family [Prauserella salsuginis]
MTTKTAGPNALSRWIQHRANASTAKRIRRKGGRSMGMDLLILHTVGKRSGEPRETPLTWFADDDSDAWLIIASGGGERHPDWYVNLMARPDRATAEWHGQDPVGVTPQTLDGAERERAWQRIVAEQPRIAKYQRKHSRQYPVVRLARR